MADFFSKLPRRCKRKSFLYKKIYIFGGGERVISHRATSLRIARCKSTESLDRKILQEKFHQKGGSWWWKLVKIGCLFGDFVIHAFSILGCLWYTPVKLTNFSDFSKWNYHFLKAAVFPYSSSVPGQRWSIPQIFRQQCSNKKIYTPVN